MSTDLDPFATLGLPAGQNLSDEQVYDAWRAIATATDPGRPDGGDPARYAAATAAYASLRTAQGRSQVYSGLAAKRGASPPRYLTQSELGNVVICCLFSVLALLVVIFAALGLPGAIRAASGKGLRGLWTATHETSKYGWHGTFQLPDGKVLLRDVGYDGALPDVHVGTRVPGLDSGGVPPIIYSQHGSQEWKTELIFLIVGSVVLVSLQVRLAVVLLRFRRRLRAEA
jgi:hypothetical protein